jgi:hypothetical protein
VSNARQIHGASSFLSLSAALACAACGAGAPLLHPAQPLPAGEMSLGAGLSSQLALGTVNSDITAGEAANPNGTSESIARRAFIGPGISPWLSARLGLNQDNEAGLTFTGRTLRVDGRHAFVSDEWALSLGAGASSVLARRTESEASNAGGVLGWGADLPVLVGWASRADVVSVWLGVRPGYESLGDFSAPGPEDPGLPAPQESLAEASHWYASGLFGLRVGVPPIWVSLELAATQHWVSAAERVVDAGGGPETETSADFRAFTLTPAGALNVRF